MKLTNPLTLLLLLVGCSNPWSQVPSSNPDITALEILSHIQYLAADEMRGRYPGTPESERSIQYIISHWQKDGILPAGEEDYRQYFDFVTNLELGSGNNLKVNGESYQVQQDYIPLGFSSNGSVSGEVVFVGYGFTIADTLEWDDYSGVDATDKWVAILRGGPEGDSPHTAFEEHLPLRKKTLLARDHGARGVVFIPRTDQEGLEELRYDHSFSGAGLPVLHVSHRVAEALLAPSGTTLAALQESIDEKRSPQSRELEGVSLTATVNLERARARIPNLVGLIPGRDPVLKNEFLVLGAHFDHLGLGGPESGSLTPDSLAVHNGADDNASGVAGILEISQRLAAHRQELQRSVLLMCYNAEERGLLGSKHYVAQPTVELDNIVTMINLDMIGRLKDNQLTVGGSGTSPGFDSTLRALGAQHDLELKLSPEGYGPSDHASFYASDRPVLFFFTGTHSDYHKPSDDWERIDPVGEKRVADLIYDLILELNRQEERPLFTAAGPKESSAPRRRFKVTFGIIPAYASQVAGLEIDGISNQEGPAAQAGLKRGDIIIAIEGKEVKDIYDYMYRLGELDPGQTIAVTIRRGAETLEVTLQL